MLYSNYNTATLLSNIIELHIAVGSHLFITGPAGCGKLYCVKEVCAKINIPTYTLIMPYIEPIHIAQLLNSDKMVLILDQIDYIPATVEGAILQLMEQNKNIVIIGLMINNNLSLVLKNRFTVIT